MSREELAIEYVALLRHSAEACPDSNSKVRERVEQNNDTRVFLQEV